MIHQFSPDLNKIFAQLIDNCFGVLVRSINIITFGTKSLLMAPTENLDNSKFCYFWLLDFYC
jgi:hypothetical protein